MKYLHYFPQFLLKNWESFSIYYDLREKTFSDSKTSIRKIGCYEAQEHQREYYSQYESDSNEEYKDLEDWAAKRFEFWKTENLKTMGNNNVYLKLISLKKDSEKVNKFLNSIISKSPIIRGGKILQSSLNSNDKKAFPISSNIDIDNLQMVINSVNFPGNKNKKLDLKNYVIYISSYYPFPWISPGYKLFSNKETKKLSIFIQISPHIFILSSSKSECLNFEMNLKKLNDNSKRADYLYKFLCHNNPILSKVYFQSLFSDNQRKIIVDYIQKEHNSSEKQKLVTMIIGTMNNENSKNFDFIIREKNISHCFYFKITLTINLHHSLAKQLIKYLNIFLLTYIIIYMNKSTYKLEKILNLLPKPEYYTPNIMNANFPNSKGTRTYYSNWASNKSGVFNQHYSLNEKYLYKLTCQTRDFFENEYQKENTKQFTIEINDWWNNKEHKEPKTQKSKEEQEVSKKIIQMQRQLITYFENHLPSINNENNKYKTKKQYSIVIRYKYANK